MMTASLTSLYSLACDPVRSTGPVWRPSRRSARTELSSLEVVHCTVSGDCSLYGLPRKWGWRSAVNSAWVCWISMHISCWTCSIDRSIAMSTNFFYCIKQYSLFWTFLYLRWLWYWWPVCLNPQRSPCQFAFIHWFVLSSFHFNLSVMLFWA